MEQTEEEEIEELEVIDAFDNGFKLVLTKAFSNPPRPNLQPKFLLAYTSVQP